MYPCFYSFNDLADTLGIDFFFKAEFVHAQQCTLQHDVLGAQLLLIAFQDAHGLCAQGGVYGVLCAHGGVTIKGLFRLMELIINPSIELNGII